jgi:hypothetical protein
MSLSDRSSNLIRSSPTFSEIAWLCAAWYCTAITMIITTATTTTLTRHFVSFLHVKKLIPKNNRSRQNIDGWIEQSIESELFPTQRKFNVHNHHISKSRAAELLEQRNQKMSGRETRRRSTGE